MVGPVMVDSRDVIRSKGNASGAVNFQSLDIKFLGAKALSVFISAIEMGVIIVLFARFFIRKRERLAIQFLIYFVTFVALYELLFHYKSIF